MAGGMKSRALHSHPVTEQIEEARKLLRIRKVNQGNTPPWLKKKCRESGLSPCGWYSDIGVVKSI